MKCFRPRNAKKMSEIRRFQYASPEARDLLVRMLKLNPEERITVDEALAHPFFPKSMGVLFTQEKINVAPAKIELDFEKIE